MRKVIALILVVSMCLAVIAGCGNGGNPETTPDVTGGDNGTNGNGGSGNNGGGGNNGGLPGGRPEGAAEREQLAGYYGLPYNPDVMDAWEPVTFTYFTNSKEAPPAEDNPILKIVEEITNVKIEFMFYDIDPKIALEVMLTVGDLPDFAYFGEKSPEFIDYRQFLPLSELIERFAPNLRAFYDPWWEFMKQDDGDIYLLAIYGTPVGTQIGHMQNKPAFWIQKDVLDHFGRAPENLDEYFEFLRVYRDLYPRIERSRTIAYSIGSPASRNTGIIDAGYFLAGNADWGEAINEDGNDILAAISPAERFTADFNRLWWEKLNEEYNLGLFGSGTFYISYESFLNQISSGYVLGFFDRAENIAPSIDTLLANGLYERTYLPLALTFPGASPNYLDTEAFNYGNGIVINPDISDPGRAVGYLDWIISEEVQRFLSWGIEDEHYYYDTNGRISRTSEQRAMQDDKSWVRDNMGRVLLELMPKMQGSYPSDNNPTGISKSPEEHFFNLSDYDKKLFAVLLSYPKDIMECSDDPKRHDVINNAAIIHSPWLSRGLEWNDRAFRNLWKR